jgi:hypothetical protein
MTNSVDKFNKGVAALGDLLAKSRPNDAAELQGLLDTLTKNRKAVAAVAQAQDATAQVKKTKNKQERAAAGDTALKAAKAALDAIGVSDLMTERACARAAEAIAADAADDIDLNDALLLQDKYGRAIARVVTVSHLTDLRIGAAGTDVGAAVVRHLRDQLDGRKGWLDTLDGKSGVTAVPSLPTEVAVEIARVTGDLLRRGVDLGGEEPYEGDAKLAKTYGKATTKKCLNGAMILVLWSYDDGAHMRHANYKSQATILRKIFDNKTKPNPIREAYLAALNAGK